MIKGASLTSLYTQLGILSLPPVAPIFLLQSWSHHGKLPLYCWSHSAGILSTHWRYTTGAINHTKISDFASISLNLHHWVHDYFTIFQLLLQLLIKAIISNAYNIFIRPLSWFVDFSFNGFVGLKNTPVTKIGRAHVWTPVTS